LLCKITPAKLRCSNYIYFNVKKKYKPAKVLLLNFLKINLEIDCLEKEEEATKATLEAKEEVTKGALR
jgi:hypothetical protein